MSDNAQVIRDAYGCFERGDIPSLLELMSDDVEWETPRIVPQGGTFNGRDGVGEFFARIGENWSELGIETENVIADGDRVIGLGVARGSLAGGGDAEYGYCHAFTVRDGKIVAFREYVAIDDKLG
jgi:ketosteroid isomerase-like protein